MNFNDEGGDQFDIDQQDTSTRRRNPKHERLERLHNQYVVAMPGRATGRMTFLQDQRVSTGGYWTQYLSNARGFKTEAAATRHASSLRYGNPRVARVRIDAEGNYIYRFDDK